MEIKFEKYWVVFWLPLFAFLLLSSTSYATTNTKTVAAHATILGQIKSMNYAIFFNGQGGNIVIANGFLLSKYTQQTNLLDGYFYQRMLSTNNPYDWQVVNFNSRGYLTVDFSIFPWLPPLYSMRVDESFTVVDTGSNVCFIVSQTEVSCQTSGYMLMAGSGIFGQSGQIPIKYLNYVFTPTSGQITGFDASNKKILEIDNIHISSLVVQTSSNPIFYSILYR